MEKAVEVNFDGLVGPTHNYAGLAFGNIASQKNANQISNPKAAALQGLEKMRLLMELGIPQAVLPPHERPLLALLRNLGFSGKEETVLKNVYAGAPEVFKALYSSSAMWTANAATVSPSADSQDGRVHFTPANLVNNLHRALETDTTHRLLKKIFSDPKHFNVHDPLFPHLQFSDEGAANHNRLCTSYGSPGIQIFVYGRDTLEKETLLPTRFPARQSLLASQSVMRLHQLDPKMTVFVKQNPTVIDQGVFHNDVISVINQNVFLYHEDAFEDANNFFQSLKEKSQAALIPLNRIAIKASELSVQDAVAAYLFNSQLISLADGSMSLIAPLESQSIKAAHQVLTKIVEDPKNPIQSLNFVDCRQSMQNGGGPACLRLRVVLTPAEQKACHGAVFLDMSLYQRLVQWINQHYRDRIALSDLLDPALIEESHRALEELTSILQLGSLYNFQKV